MGVFPAFLLETFAVIAVATDQWYSFSPSPSKNWAWETPSLVFDDGFLNPCSFEGWNNRIWTSYVLELGIVVKELTIFHESFKDHTISRHLNLLISTVTKSLHFYPSGLTAGCGYGQPQRTQPRSQSAKGWPLSAQFAYDFYFCSLFVGAGYEKW